MCCYLAAVTCCALGCSCVTMLAFSWLQVTKKVQVEHTLKIVETWPVQVSAAQDSKHAEHYEVGDVDVMSELHSCIKR